MGILTRSIEHAPCTVEISHRFESLHAHVRFNNGAVIYPGDEVKVNGPEIMAPFGEIVTEDRDATIIRASKLERWWTRMTGDLEVMELCEFSFSEEVTLGTRRHATPLISTTPKKASRYRPNRRNMTAILPRMS